MIEVVLVVEAVYFQVNLVRPVCIKSKGATYTIDSGRMKYISDRYLENLVVHIVIHEW